MPSTPNASSVLQGARSAERSGLNRVAALDPWTVGLHSHLVHYVRMLVALLLVALWLPASSHVHLERLGLIHQVHAEHHHHGHANDGDADDHGDSQPVEGEQHTSGHDAADGNLVQVSSDGGVDGSRLAALPVAPCLDFAEMAPSLPPASPDHTGLEPPGVAPPESIQRWHFASRAALPVRAPSFVS